MKMTLNMTVLCAAVVVLIVAGCKQPDGSEPGGPDTSAAYSGDGFGEVDAAWAADSYNAAHRVFPNAPANGILTYPGTAGNTDNYFDKNAQVTYWNGKGHNHKYPDLFHFANGNAVKNLKDWETRQKEIYNILSYYMHGRMPPTTVVQKYEDNGNTCTISLKNGSRTATMVVTHTPPADAVAGAKNLPILFGVGGAPNATRHPGWGTAAFNTSWGGSESDRSGTCATLFNLTPSAADTPSVNMEYAWAMSIIITVIEWGGFNGYYDPNKIGIYGFSRYGKAAMCIGAFAQGNRNGSKIAFTFVGSAGCGGPALDRWTAQMGYKNHTEDPLPVITEGVPNGGMNSYDDLKGIEWFIKKPIVDDHNAATASEVVRGWTASTPGIPEGALVYGEYTETASNFIRNPGPGYSNPGSPNDWGRIQVLSQARSEQQGWFSARFQQFTNNHALSKLDKDSGGVLCTMPFDSHYLAALIAPRIIYYEDGYDTVRNNPESQWANWLMCDEIYQMYAEQLKDPKIIWRNAIKMYDIPHMPQNYQDQDESDLVTALLNGQTPNAKFRTPPFPVDDPRYRWEFDRMDWGRPGHPTIAERVRKMRESSVPVKAMDTRGLLDAPEPLN